MPGATPARRSPVDRLLDRLVGHSRLTIRWRITLGSVIVAVGLFFVAAVVFYQVVSSIVVRSERSILVEIESELSLDIEAGSQPHLEDPTNGQLYATLDPAGELTESTLPPSLYAEAVGLLPDETAPGGGLTGSRFETIEAGGSQFLVRFATFPSADGVWTILTARDQEPTRLLLDDITHALAIGAVVLVAVFGATSWVLTGAALTPVRRMRARADELSTFPVQTDLLPVRDTRDELDELATTLNAFLTRQSDSVAREKQMVSDASHELRTPLAALSAQLEIARSRASDPSGDRASIEQAVTDAQRSADRLARLANTLLDISRIESLQVQPSTGFDELIDEAVAAVDRARLVAAPAGVELDYEIDEVAYEIDEVAGPGAGPGAGTAAGYGLSAIDFGRVIENLCRNAIAAVARDGRVTVSLGRSASGSLLATVIDDGPGMPESFIPVAFDRFSRPDSSRASSLGGSGLGLALVHTTVTAAGGTVRLTNRAPHGLEVAIELPPRPAPPAS